MELGGVWVSFDVVIGKREDNWDDDGVKLVISSEAIEENDIRLFRRRKLVHVKESQLWQDL
jgi:hypothetical protein